MIFIAVAIFLRFLPIRGVVPEAHNRKDKDSNDKLGPYTKKFLIRTKYGPNKDEVFKK